MEEGKRCLVMVIPGIETLTAKCLLCCLLFFPEESSSSAAFISLFMSEYFARKMQKDVQSAALKAIWAGKFKTSFFKNPLRESE